MANLIEIPPILAIAAVAFQVLALVFAVKIGRRAHLAWHNGFTLAISLGLLRRAFELLITWDFFEPIAYTVRYISLTYTPVIFTVFLIIGMLQLYSRLAVSRLKEKEA